MHCLFYSYVKEGSSSFTCIIWSWWNRLTMLMFLVLTFWRTSVFSQRNHALSHLYASNCHVIMHNIICSLIHKPIAVRRRHLFNSLKTELDTANNKETFLQDFLGILKHSRSSMVCDPLWNGWHFLKVLKRTL